MKYKVPLYYVLIFSAITGVATYFFFFFLNEFQQKNDTSNQTVNTQSCLLNVKRLNGYKYIQPLVFTKQGCESEFLKPIHEEISQIIENYKQEGILTNASVYIRLFGQGEWTCINENENFRPGSLMKVPELITFLREEELHPGSLNRALKYSSAFTTNKTPVFLSKSIELGKSYTIRELLRYMIEYSDNNATMILNNNMNVALFKKTFSDFGLKEPDMSSSDYPISVKDYSIFFEALYNAGYLSIQNSEYAVELLTKCNFKAGLVAGLPDSSVVAHKFGEAGDNDIKEFHECGIVYSGNKRYQITIMTKGKSLAKLPEVVKRISKVAYDRING